MHNPWILINRTLDVPSSIEWQSQGQTTKVLNENHSKEGGYQQANNPFPLRRRKQDQSHPPRHQIKLIVALAKENLDTKEKRAKDWTTIKAIGRH